MMARRLRLAALAVLPPLHLANKGGLQCVSTHTALDVKTDGEQVCCPQCRTVECSSGHCVYFEILDLRGNVSKIVADCAVHGNDDCVVDPRPDPFGIEQKRRNCQVCSTPLCNQLHRCENCLRGVSLSINGSCTGQVFNHAASKELGSGLTVVSFVIALIFFSCMLSLWFCLDKVLTVFDIIRPHISGVDTELLTVWGSQKMPHDLKEPWAGNDENESNGLLLDDDSPMSHSSQLASPSSSPVANGHRHIPVVPQERADLEDAALQGAIQASLGQRAEDYHLPQGHWSTHTARVDWQEGQWDQICDSRLSAGRFQR